MLAATTRRIAWLAVSVAIAGLLLAGTTPCRAQGVPLALPTPDTTSPLRWKGLEVDLPGPADTVDRDAGGVRATLAANGIGYLGVSLQTLTNNMLDVATTTNGKQLYSGQRPTYVTQDFFLLTYDTGRLGWTDGQIVVGGSRSVYTWRQGGPDKFGLLTLSYYQPLFDDRVAVKIGYLANSFEFANPYVGGTLAAGVFGQNSNYLLQGGLNGGGVTTPGVEVRVALPNSFYTKVAVERPISPDGTIVETAQNPTSLRFRVPNTGVLAIDESGYKVPAQEDRREVWVRGAFATNSSRSIDLATPTTRKAGENYFTYLLVDYQIVPFDPKGKPTRGLYGGGTLSYAPPEFNRFSRFAQARLYAKGPLDARPSDLVSLVAAYTGFSDEVYRTSVASGQLAHRGSIAVTGSYGAHLAPGAYLNLGLTYVDHPTTVVYTPRTGSALNAQLNLSLFF